MKQYEMPQLERMKFGSYTLPHFKNRSRQLYMHTCVLYYIMAMKESRMIINSICNAKVDEKKSIALILVYCKAEHLLCNQLYMHCFFYIKNDYKSVRCYEGNKKQSVSQYTSLLCKMIYRRSFCFIKNDYAKKCDI